LQGLRPAVVPASDLDRCRELLFSVYHQEMGWTPAAENPSGLRLVQGPPSKMVDQFDESALWLGIYRGDALVACTRVILSGEGQDLEVTRYIAVDPALTHRAMEVNRMAIRRDSRGGGTFAIVALMLRWVGQHYQVQRALVASEVPLAQKLYRPLGWQAVGERFRYHADDRHECQLLTIEPHGLHLAISLGKTVLRSIGRAFRAPAHG
jgi:predicted GNAT family N-acyltransferase